MIDRRVVDALYALPERNRFMTGLYAWVGFRSIANPIDLDQRRTVTAKFGMRNLFRLGLTGVTSFTAWPLRIWTSIGMATATCSILYGLWIFARTRCSELMCQVGLRRSSQSRFWAACN